MLDIAAEHMLSDRGVTPACLGNIDPGNVLKDCYVDISQNPERTKWTRKDGMNHTLCTSSVWYSFGQDRVLLPEEYLFVQGWERDVCISEEIRPKVREMATLGFSLPCLGSLMWALYLLREFPS